MIGELFEVEKLCDKKVENGIVYYLVKWMGFGEDEIPGNPKPTLWGHIQSSTSKGDMRRA